MAAPDPSASAEASTPLPAQAIRRPRAVLAMSEGLFGRFFDAAAQGRLAELADLDPALVLTEFGSPRARAALADAEVLLTGWGCPPLDAEALAAAPRLAAVVHTAGSVKGFWTDACRDRGLAVTSAAGANAVPVAEYTVAAVLFSGKGVLRARDAYRARPGEAADWQEFLAADGNHRRRVGVLGASRIGRRVLELLRAFDFELHVSDPYLTPDQAEALGARLVDNAELFARCSTVSLHAPWLPETEGLVGPELLAALPDGAVLINTARGAIVQQDALIAELETGRISAVIDVTHPEVPEADSPLYRLPNVLLTPHIAGSMGNELHRMGAFALDELERWTRGERFADPVSPELLARTA